jgi:preprotein translocase SecE subunit
MGAFWLLFMLMAYGVFGAGFLGFVTARLKGLGIDTSPWLSQVPLLGDLGPATLVAVLLQSVIALLLHRFLTRPKAVTYLVETEAEMRKVVWPSWKETRSGAAAVMVTVTILLLYLLAVDAFFLEAVSRLLSLGANAGTSGG